MTAPTLACIAGCISDHSDGATCHQQPVAVADLYGRDIPVALFHHPHTGSGIGVGEHELSPAAAVDLAAQLLASVGAALSIPGGGQFAEVALDALKQVEGRITGLSALMDGGAR